MLASSSPVQKTRITLKSHYSTAAQHFNTLANESTPSTGGLADF